MRIKVQGDAHSEGATRIIGLVYLKLHTIIGCLSDRQFMVRIHK